MLHAAERPLIVAGGGIINADAAGLLVEFAELTGVPVVPTLMGWGTIPDDHPLMAGMVGLQTSHRYGNATMLASRLRARHRQPLGQPPHRLGWTPTRRAARSCTSTSSRRRSAASSRPTSASSPTRRRRSSCSSRWRASDAPQARCRTAAPGSTDVPAAQGDAAAQDALRRRSDQAAAGLRGDESGLRPRRPLRHHDRPVPDRRRAVPARVRAAALDQLRSGRPARAGRCPPRSGVRRRRPGRAPWSRCPATTTSSS